MKKTITSKLKSLATLAAAAFILGNAPNADAQMYVGYASTDEVVYPYTGFNNGSDQEMTLYFTLRIDKSKLAGYAGASLGGVRVGWSEGATPKTPDMEVFVREDRDGENLASGTQTVAYGYNDIYFDAPYTISGDKDIYIGGKVAWTPDSWLATGVFGCTLPEGTQFMANDQDRDADGNLRWVDATDNSMAMLVWGIIEAADDEYQNLGSLQKIRANDVQYLDSSCDAWLVVKNEGLNEIKSFEISAAFGDRTWSQEIELSQGLAPGSDNKITGGIQALGSGVHDVWLSKINGAEVANPVKQQLEIIAVPSDVASKYTRRPLVERWVSENEYRTPVYTDEYFTPGLKDFVGSVSLLAHHIDDQFMIYHEFETDVNCEDVKYLIDFANGNKNRVSVPAFSVDRSFIPRNPLARPADESVAYNFIMPDYAPAFYQAALEVPTFVSVTPTANEADGVISVSVEGNIEPSLLPEGEDLFLTVCLLEDGISSTSQEFPDDPEVTEKYKGVFTHNDVIRAKLTPMYGDNIGASGNFSKTYLCDVDGEWNLANMRVLAFVNRSEERYQHMQVLNSAESALVPTGVADIEAADGFAVYTSGRDIMVSGADSFRVYSLDGRRVNSRDLLPGIYVVCAETPAGTVSKKVSVK